MKAPSLAAVAFVAVTFAAAAYAGAGPTSPLYLTYVNYPSSSAYDIHVVQGHSMTSFPEHYDPPWEIPIAVDGDVRTTGYEYFSQRQTGGQYTLSGTATGTTYVLPSLFGDDGTEDSTSDGTHNYLVNLTTGTVHQTARDFTNPVGLFTAAGTNPLGITYDSGNNSLWISGLGNSTVADYSLNGTLLSSFSTGHIGNAALALDPADGTLWLVYATYAGGTGNLEQYTQAGVLLSTGPYVGDVRGGEFNLAASPTPEPGTLVMFGCGILGLAGLLRRKIDL